MPRSRTAPKETTEPTGTETPVGPQYVCTSSHVEDLADGRTVEPGGIVTLDSSAAAEPHNAALIDAGTLLLVETEPQKED